MRTVLIITPHFPPINGADVHRVRTSLPFYQEFGWNPIILAVDPASIEQQWEDPDLLSSIPEDVIVHRVKAWPHRITRPFGIGAIGLRAYRAIAREGAKMVHDHQPSLAFFSTTAFPLMAIGRRWKRQFRLNYVLDIQDPWIPETLGADAAQRQGFKHRAMRAIHRYLEPRAMKEADGLIAVADDYIDLLKGRYPELVSVPSSTIRFGVSPRDWEIARAKREPQKFFSPSDGLIHGVCVGAYSVGMEFALRAFLHGLASCRESDPRTVERIRIHFVGTSYGTDSQHTHRIGRMATEAGVENQVSESPARVPFYAAMQLQTDADFLILLGSSERGYVPSRLAGMLLAERPIMAVCHQKSGAAVTLSSIKTAFLATYESTESASLSTVTNDVGRLLASLPSSLKKGLSAPVDPEIIRPLLTRELTRKQCNLFDQVCRHSDKSMDH